MLAGDGTNGGTTTTNYDTVGNVTSTVDALGNTTVYHYDADRRLLGVVYPDPDGSGPRTPLARQYSYNARGVKWQDSVGTVTDQSDSAWASYSETYHNYAQLDAYDRTVRTTTWSSGTDYTVADYLYDNAGHLTCTVQYMDPSNWGPQATTCAPLQTSGSNGPDRVTQASYDDDGRVSTVTEGIGTSAQGVTATYGYTNNGKAAYVIDGNNNRTSYVYDGFDRMVQTQYPSSSKGANSSNTGDYEAVLAYDANGHPTQTRLRDGTTIGLTYDNLGRMTTRTVQNNVSQASDYPTTTSYNLLGQVTTVTRPNDGTSVTYNYDILGRFNGEQQTFGSVSYTLDLNGRRTAQTWSDGFYVNYDYDNTGQVTAIRENGATSGVGVLASYSYDSAGRRTGVTYGNGTSRSYGYDAVSRMTGLQLTFPNASGYNHTIGGLNGTGTAIGYSPASQIASIAKSNDSFAWTGAVNADRNYVTNGLNQYTSDGQVSFGYDGRGNLTSSGTQSFGYNKENQLISGPNGTTIYYDPLGRINEYDTTVSTRFYYAGGAIAAEIANNGTNAVLRRYVMGPGTDEPIVWYEGSGTSDRRFLQADERGSIIAVTNSGGSMLGVNSYDEYGIPGANNLGRFQYTGQAWYGEVGLYNFKARWYSPTLGRFMQTDPIGYGDGLNWHNYAHSDPINGTDPTGTDDGPEIVVTATTGDLDILYDDLVTPLTTLTFNDPSGITNPTIVVKARRANNPFSWLPDFYQNSEQTPQSEPPCPGGPRLVIGYGGSATGFLATFGLSGSAGAGIAIPIQSLLNFSLRGSQGFVTGSVTQLSGAGFFAGAGGSWNGGITGGPIKSGSSVGGVIQGGAADGVGGEGAVALTDNGQTFTGVSGANVSGGARYGVGGYGALGVQGSYTRATGQLGCH